MRPSPEISARKLRRNSTYGPATKVPPSGTWRLKPLPRWTGSVKRIVAWRWRSRTHHLRRRDIRRGPWTQPSLRPGGGASLRALSTGREASLRAVSTATRGLRLAGRTLREHAARGTLVNAAFLVGLSLLGLVRGFVLAGLLTRTDYGV